MILPLVLAAVWIVYLQSVTLVPTYTFATVSNQAYTFTGSASFLNPLPVLQNPWYSLNYELSFKLVYLTLVFGPFLFLSWLAPRWLLPAVPWVFVVLFFSPLLSTGGIGAVYVIWSQWSAFLVPFVVIAAIFGFRRLTRWTEPADPSLRTGRRRVFVPMVVSMAIVVVAAGAFSPFLAQSTLSIGDNLVPNDVPAGAFWHDVWPTPVSNTPEIDHFISLIPEGDSVLTQNQIGSKLAERQAPVYVFFQPGTQIAHTNAILVDTQIAGYCFPCLTQTLSTGNYTLYDADPGAGISLYFEVT
jgi:uncharacterized membrane protein